MRKSVQSVKESCSGVTCEFQRFFLDQFNPLSQKLEPVEILTVSVEEVGAQEVAGDPKNGPEGQNFISPKIHAGISLSGIFLRGRIMPAHICPYQVDL